jgi:hypothetical protein
MTEPTQGLLRLLRSAGVGAGVVVVSLTGHLAAHADVPHATALWPAVALATVVCWMLSAVRWTLTSLLGVMIAAQSVLHVVFVWGAADTGAHWTLPMLLGHVVATVIVVIALYRGEALIWTVVESLGLRMWRLLRPVAVPAGGIVWMPAIPVRAAAPRCWHGGVPPRRGPPRG